MWAVGSVEFDLYVEPFPFPKVSDYAGYAINSFFVRVKEGPLSALFFSSFMYNIWQDAGIRTRYAATSARYATNELNTSLNELHTFLRAIGYINILWRWFMDDFNPIDITFFRRSVVQR